MSILTIKNLTIAVKDKIILKNISLNINEGEVHALIGPNGHGKSTLLLSLMNHFAYEILDGEIVFNNKNTKNMQPNEISKLGMFLGFQSPFTIHGLKTIDFLKAIVNAHRKSPISTLDYYLQTKKNLEKLSLDKSILERDVNLNFSGGEKKKNELLQMLMLENKLVLLDEIDSGLDVDNINEIIKIVNYHHQKTKTSYLIVSHYDKMFLTLNVDYTHLVFNQKMITIKGDSLIKQVHKYGYKRVIENLGLNNNTIDYKNEKQDTSTSLSSCAFKKND